MNTPFYNRLKHLIKDGKRTVGAWLQIGSPLSAEIFSRAGFDYLIVDMEHGPIDFMNLINIFQAIDTDTVTPIVRAPWNDFVTIKRILDAGAYGVLVPYVNNKAEAEAAVAACKHPPVGVRGVAGSPRAAGYGQNPAKYLQIANDEIMVMIAVETGEAIKNLDEILTVPGLDGCFIGPMDLATSLGHHCDPGHPEVQNAIATIESKVIGSGKILSTIAGTWEQARAKYDKGYLMLMVMADGVALGKMASEKVRQFRKEYPEG